jgi:hypothetical protein
MFMQAQLAVTCLGRLCRPNGPIQLSPGREAREEGKTQLKGPTA